MPVKRSANGDIKFIEPFTDYDKFLVNQNLKEIDVLKAQKTIALANRDFSKVERCDNAIEYHEGIVHEIHGRLADLLSVEIDKEKAKGGSDTSKLDIMEAVYKRSQELLKTRGHY